MQATHEQPTRTRVTLADVLRGAARYLQLHGWTQGQFFDLTGGTPDAFPPACVAGAISIAASGHCVAHPYTDLGDEAADDAIRATRTLAAYLDPDYASRETSAIDVVGDWNDASGRTLAEVLDALTAAADGYCLAPVGGAR